MNSQLLQNEIDEDRAAALLGISRTQLRQLCERAGLKESTMGNDSKQRKFTYRGLYRLCRQAVRQVS